MGEMLRALLKKLNQDDSADFHALPRSSRIIPAAPRSHPPLATTVTAEKGPSAPSRRLVGGLGSMSVARTVHH